MRKITGDQQRAVADVVRWATGLQTAQVYKLFGYAGTGKTTIAREIADELDATTFFCAPTAKAASVLTSKGCDATTLHKLIYRASGRGSIDRIRELIQELSHETDERARRSLKRELDLLRQPTFTPHPMSPLVGDAEANSRKLVIIDECSMVDEKMARDLLSFGVKVLALGDPAQLPPVRGPKYFDGDPDWMLTEIHRSAKDSPVTRFAEMARTGRVVPRKLGSSGCKEMWISHIKPGSYGRFDQVIVGTNATRHRINGLIRDHLGLDPHRPVVGDRVVCLRNNYELGILNGEQYTVDNVVYLADRYLLDLSISGAAEQITVPAAREPFFDESDQPDGHALGIFTWGYAITAHKAQGSQWPRVLVLRENWRGDTPQWLYTAVTRASQQVHIVMPPRR